MNNTASSKKSKPSSLISTRAKKPCAKSRNCSSATASPSSRPPSPVNSPVTGAKPTSTNSNPQATSSPECWIIVLATGKELEILETQALHQLRRCLMFQLNGNGHLLTAYVWRGQ